MAKKMAEPHTICGKRVNDLCEEYGITQKQLAEKAGIHPNTVNKIVRGRIPLMSDYIAHAIESAFPSFSAEYLKGQVDYRTEQEQFDALIQKHRNLHQKKIYLLQSLASLRGFEIMPYSVGINMGKEWEDQYILRHGSNQMYISDSVITEWLEEICDFAELKFSRQIKKGESANG